MRPGRIIAIVVAVLAVLGIGWLLSSRRVPVMTARIGRGPVRLVVEEEGRTRVAERYVVSAPVAGRLLRVEREEGEAVAAGDVLFVVEDLPLAAAVAAAEARIRGARARLAGVDRQRPKPEEEERAKEEVEWAKATLTLAEKEAEEARAAEEQARREAERARSLFAERTIAAAAKEDAELAEKRARAALAGAEAMIRIRGIEARSAALAEKVVVESGHDVDWQEDQARAEIDAAQADLEVLRDDLARAKVAAPAAGTVLRLFREDQAVVPAGTPVLEVGDLGDLEVEADLLSEDAARMRTGLPAEVFGRALGDRTVPGALARVYPAAFTKISSLGVEQQRTTVVVRPDGPLGLRGDRYRVDVRVILEARPDALLVPESALFREAGEWKVFVVEAGRARKARVATGIRDGRYREVAEGLSEGDEVVVFPPDDLEDGARVE